MRVNNGQTTFIVRRGGLCYNKIIMEWTEDFFFFPSFFTKEEINYFHEVLKEIQSHAHFCEKKEKKNQG